LLLRLQLLLYCFPTLLQLPACMPVAGLVAKSLHHKPPLLLAERVSVAAQKASSHGDPSRLDE
jgi:hypothetical protein